MNLNFRICSFLQVFHKRMPPEAIDLASRLLQYSPSLRCTAVSWTYIHWVPPATLIFFVFLQCNGDITMPCNVLFNEDLCRPASVLNLQFGAILQLLHLAGCGWTILAILSSFSSWHASAIFLTGYHPITAWSMHTSFFWWTSWAQCTPTKWSPIAASFQLQTRSESSVNLFDVELIMKNKAC